MKQTLEGTIVTAPCDGEGVYIAELTAGDRVAAHSPVAYIADQSRLYVRFDGSENIPDKSRTTAFINGKEYGVIKEKYDQREYLSLVLSGRSPPTLFRFERAPEGARAGDFAALTVYEDERPGVLAVPVNSIYYNVGEYYVYLIIGGQKVYNKVKCGMRTDSFVEITEGLQEGDEVFVKQ